MKIEWTFVIVLFNSVCFSQSTIQFMDADTKGPLCGIYSTIYKNEDTFENCGGSNINGFYKIEIKKVDPKANYYLSYNDDIKYKPIWKKISTSNKDTLQVFMERSKYYYDTAEELLKSICGQYSFFGYTPRQPGSLDDLPKSIQNKTIAYLKNRVGNSEFENFKLIGGQIIDLKEFKRRIPKSNQKTAYYLCFSYRNIDVGISNYTSKIELDEEGNILKDIDFPIVKPNSIQEKIVPLKSIIQNAINKDFYKQHKTKFQMDYDTKNNILVWKLINETYSSNYTYLKEELIYNAHTGEFISSKSDNGQWID